MAKKVTCHVCQAPATVFVSFITGDKLTQACYCQTHAEEAGVLNPMAFGLLDEGGATKGPLAEVDTLVCPECGYSRRMFKQTGRMGCARCYDTFHADVEALIPRMHRGTEHKGRVPKQRFDSKLVNNRLRALEAEMRQAIQDERYEDAATARDEMSDLRAKLETGCEMQEKNA